MGSAIGVCSAGADVIVAGVGSIWGRRGVSGGEGCSAGVGGSGDVGCGGAGADVVGGGVGGIWGVNGREGNSDGAGGGGGGGGKVVEALRCWPHTNVPGGAGVAAVLCCWFTQLAWCSLFLFT